MMPDLLRAVQPTQLPPDSSMQEVAVLTAEEFLARGPTHPTTISTWPEQFASRADLYNDHPFCRLPSTRPTADQLASALQRLASTDHPARDYPEDFFSREVIYADHD